MLRLGASSVPLPTYQRSGRLTQAQSSSESVAAQSLHDTAHEQETAAALGSASANVHVHARGESGGTSTLMIGAHANVQVNTRGDSAGSSTLIVGDGANVHINGRGDSTGPSTLIVGDDANVHVNARGDSAGWSKSISEGSNWHLKARSAYAAQQAVGTVGPKSGTTGENEDLRAPATTELAPRNPPEARPRATATADDGALHERSAWLRRRLERTSNEPEKPARPAQLDPRLALMRELVESTVRKRATSATSNERDKEADHKLNDVDAKGKGSSRAIEARLTAREQKEARTADREHREAYVAAREQKRASASTRQNDADD